MAAISRKIKRSSLKAMRGRGAKNALAALSLAAMALPGLITGHAHAQDGDGDGVDIQETHYAEGKRELWGMPFGGPFEIVPTQLPQSLAPITADSLRIMTRSTFSDRVKIFVNYSNDTWSGATPVATGYAGAFANWALKSADGQTLTGASPLLRLDANRIPELFDRKLNSYNLFSFEDPIPVDNHLSHIMSSASPETRNQIDGKVRYEWDNSAFDVGGGISKEPDYVSSFVNVGGRIDVDQKLTSLTWGLSYTSSQTRAILDPDGLPYFDTLHYLTGVPSNGIDHAENGWLEATFDPTHPLIPTSAIMHGNRSDWSGQLGISRILNKNTVVSFDVGYTHSSGYLSNPYKAVVGHTIQYDPGQEMGFETAPDGTGGAYLEVRPGGRNLLNAHAGLAQYVAPLNAGLHLDYSYAHDDWGIDAHTFEVAWAQPIGKTWLVTPTLRYYSQSAADFYTAGIFRIYDGEEQTRAYPKYFSSDERLSGFGTLSAGLTVNKQLLPGVSIEPSFEYFTHRGALKMGGKGEQDFADYDYWTFGLALKLKPGGFSSATRFRDGSHPGHRGHGAHHDSVPAGVMLDHTLAEAGDYMVGYTFMRSSLGGSFMSGTQTISLDSVLAAGCGGKVCAATPDNMNMNMHMFHLMYAPTNYLTLAVMPQLTAMDMDMTHNPDLVLNSAGHSHGGHDGAAGHSHATGGFGDTGFFAIFKIADKPNSRVTLAFGGTAPTGNSDIKERKTSINPDHDQYVDYGMQTGTGTWDFIPALTYEGNQDKKSWGAQVTGTVHNGENKAGYALGDVLQGSIWGGYRWSDWLTTTARAIYTTQGRIRGEFPKTTHLDYYTGEPLFQKHYGPSDQPANYGGKFLDVGLGIKLTVPKGPLAGKAVKIEWVQPVHQDVNGYQLKQKGTLFLSWSTAY